MKHARVDYDVIQAPESMIPADEPVFLIRGQDENGGDAVRRWAEMAERRGASLEIVHAAREHARLMDLWPKKKTPDMPGAKDA